MSKIRKIVKKNKSERKNVMSKFLNHSEEQKTKLYYLLVESNLMGIKMFKQKITLKKLPAARNDTWKNFSFFALYCQIYLQKKITAKIPPNLFFCFAFKILFLEKILPIFYQYLQITFNPSKKQYRISFQFKFLILTNFYF